MEGKTQLSYLTFSSTFNSRRDGQFATLFVIYRREARIGICSTAAVIEETYNSIGLYLMSQFFWMQEQNLFFILFQGRPGKCLLIYDHFLPIQLYSSMIFLSSSSVQSSFLILGSSLLMNLYLICFPVLVPSIQERSFQFFPIFLINFLTVSSSSEDHIFRWAPNCDSLRQRCRHWFSLRSFIRLAMTAHFFGYFSQSIISWLSQSTLHVLTFRFLQLKFLWRISMLTLLPSCLSIGIINWHSISSISKQLWKIDQQQSHLIGNMNQESQMTSFK